MGTGDVGGMIERLDARWYPDCSGNWDDDSVSLVGMALT